MSRTDPARVASLVRALRSTRVWMWRLLAVLAAAGVAYLAIGAGSRTERDLVAFMLMLTAIQATVLWLTRRVGEDRTLRRTVLVEICRAAIQGDAGSLVDLVLIATDGSADESRLASMPLVKAGTGVLGWLVVAIEQQRGRRRVDLIELAAKIAGAEIDSLPALIAWREGHREECEAAERTLLERVAARDRR